MQELKRGPRPHLPRERMLELWKEGKTDKEIAEAVGIPRNNVCAWRLAAGLPVHKELRCAEDLWDDALVRKLYEEGRTDVEIANAAGVSRNAVFRWRQKYSLPTLQARRNDYSKAAEGPEVLEKMRAMWAEQRTDAEIARALGLKYFVVRNCRIENGVSSALRSVHKSEALVRQLYEEGLNDGEIAREIGVCGNTVFRWRKENNLPANSRKRLLGHGSDALSQRHQQMLDLWWQGKTDKEISLAVGISRAAVCSWRRRNSLDLNPGQRGNPIRWDQRVAMDLYKAGASDSQIGRAVGVNSGSIFSWRTKNGLPANKIRTVKPVRKRTVDLERMQQLYKQGMPDCAIAEELKISRHYVAKLRQELGLPANQKHAAIVERGQKMLSLYEQGMSDGQIALEIGVCTETVRSWRRRSGLQSHADAGRSARELDRMRLYEQGLNDSAIARTLNLAPSSVYQWRARNGLPANRRRGGRPDGPVLPMPKAVAPVPQMPKAVTRDWFYMTDDEILRSWNRAVSRREQVQILADLNACSLERMEEKLESLGVDLALEFGPKKGRRGACRK